MCYSSPLTWCGCWSVCVCFRNTSHRSASLRSLCSRTTTWPTRPSCTDRPSRAGRGTSASTGTDRSWRGTVSRRPRGPHTFCPNSLKVQQRHFLPELRSRGRGAFILSPLWCSLFLHFLYTKQVSSTMKPLSFRFKAGLPATTSVHHQRWQITHLIGHFVALSCLFPVQKYCWNPKDYTH